MRGGNSITINNQLIPSLDKNKIAELEYDIVIVGGLNVSMPAVLKDAKQLGLDEDKIVLDRTICIPGFSLENYKRLRKSNLTIISRNCWGGMVYHAFGLPFRSPFINIVANEPGEFLKFLHNPMSYLNKELRLCKVNFNKSNNEYYPSFYLGDILLTMLHYTDADSVNTARQKWEERLLKINWFNVLVKHDTGSIKELNEFDDLPFAKKICVVPFASERDSAFHIDYAAFPNVDRNFIEFSISNTNFWHYNLWDLLLYGKKTPINQ